jgi:hypothetical protein
VFPVGSSKNTLRSHSEVHLHRDYRPQLGVAIRLLLCVAIRGACGAIAVELACLQKGLSGLFGAVCFLDRPLLRPTGYNGGAGDNHDTSAFLPPTSSNFPGLANLPPNGVNPYFTLQTTGTAPDFPGIGRNTFRGPRYQDIDLTVAKEFGLPTMRVIGEGARIQLRMTAYNAFNKLNLAPFSFGSTSTLVSSCCGSNTTPLANPLFGTATSGLVGRVLELQARFAF